MTLEQELRIKYPRAFMSYADGLELARKDAELTELMKKDDLYNGRNDINEKNKK